MKRRLLLFVTALPVLPMVLIARPAANSDTLSAKIDAYVSPYVEGKNFSGSILIGKAGKVLFHRSYGMANWELAVPNSPGTRFHVASISKSFTAAAVLMLEEQGRLSVKDPLTKFISDYPNGSTIITCSPTLLASLMSMAFLNTETSREFA